LKLTSQPRCDGRRSEFRLVFVEAIRLLPSAAAKFADLLDENFADLVDEEFADLDDIEKFC
jgi:hypothetical protein